MYIGTAMSYNVYWNNDVFCILEQRCLEMYIGTAMSNNVYWNSDVLNVYWNSDVLKCISRQRRKLRIVKVCVDHGTIARRD